MFGEVTSCVVKTPVTKPTTEGEENTLFGFINFKEKSDAKDAFAKARET